MERIHFLFERIDQFRMLKMDPDLDPTEYKCNCIPSQSDMICSRIFFLQYVSFQKAFVFDKIKKDI